LFIILLLREFFSGLFCKPSIKVRIMFNKLFQKRLFCAHLTSILLLFSIISTLPAYAQNLTSQPDTTDAEFGYIQLTTEVDSFYVVINRDYNQPRFVEFADLDSLRLEAGVNHLTIIKPYHFDIRLNTQVFSDSTRRLGINLREFLDNDRNKYSSSYPRLVWGGRVMIRSDSDTELFINGENAGMGMAVLEQPGTYEIAGRAFDSKTFRTNVNVSNEPQFEIVDFYYRPDRSRARVFSFIPGASQIYKGQTVKAGVFIGLTAITGGLALNERSKFEDTDRRFFQAGVAYGNALDPQSALELGNRIEELDSERSRFARNRNRLFGGLAAIYAVNVIDGLLRPRMGYREGVSFDPYLDFERGATAAGISLRGKF